MDFPKLPKSKNKHINEFVEKLEAEAKAQGLKGGAVELMYQDSGMREVINHIIKAELAYQRSLTKSLRVVGQNIKQIRVKQKLTSGAMAKKISISEDYYRKIENGSTRLPLGLLKEIVVVLGIKSSDVLPF